MMPATPPLHVTPSPGQDREEPEQAQEEDIPTDDHGAAGEDESAAGRQPPDTAGREGKSAG
jgi:hypothetical protein